MPCCARRSARRASQASETRSSSAEAVTMRTPSSGSASTSARSPRNSTACGWRAPAWASSAGSLSRNRQSQLAAPAAAKARAVAPVPHPRSSTAPPPAASTARVRRVASRARKSAGSRRSSQSASNPISEIGLVPAARYMAFVQRHANLAQPPAIAEALGFGGVAQRAPDMVAEKLGGGELAREFRLVVEIAVAQRGQRRRQRLGRQPDIDDKPVIIQIFGEKRGIHDERGPVDALSRAKDRGGQGMCDHDVITDFDGKHERFLQ